MRQTKKYASACEILTFPHVTQEQLYQELNRLGWFWDSKKQQWIRDDRIAEAPSKLIKIRLWANKDKVEQIADVLQEALAPYGLKVIEKSELCLCRPPQQNDARIYFTLEDDDEVD